MVTLLLATFAHAAPCDAKALAAEVTTASPTALPARFLDLVACDAAKAKELAPAAVPRFIEGDTTPDAVVAAIRLGADGAVRGWLSGLEPDVRSRMVGALGARCPDAPAVGTFFAAAARAEPETFYKQRWHGALDQCRTPEVRELLTNALSSPQVGRDSRNRSAFFSVLEVYARNLGGEAVPKLAELLGTARDEEEATVLVNIFGDAARVTSSGAGDPAAAKASAEAIEAAAPNLPARAVERARDTLVAMGQLDAAERMAGHRWADRRVDGQLTWGVQVAELVTCKNSEQRAVVHVTSGQTAPMWPTLASETLLATAKGRLKLDAAAKCKGQGTVEARISPEPLTADELAAWVTTTTEQAEAQWPERKRTVVTEAPLGAVK